MLFLLGLGWLAIVEWKWIAARSPALGLIVALGFGARLVLTGALFAISYFDLGIARGLHTGGGFWTMAPDSQSYYKDAAAAAAGSLFDLSADAASPGYLEALALWLRLAGVSVPSALLFNVACSMGTAAAVVASGTRHQSVSRVVPAVLVALTFSPMLVLTGTQILKDPFFFMLVVVAGLIAFRLLADAGEPVTLGTRVWLVGAGAGALGLIAAMRTYYAIFIWAALAGGFAVRAVWPAPSAPGRVGPALRGAVVLLVLGLAVALGAGPDNPLFLKLKPASAAAMVRASREGFGSSGGATNMVGRTRSSTGDLSTSDPSVGLPADLVSIFKALPKPSSAAYDVGGFRVFVVYADGPFARTRPAPGPDLPAALQRFAQDVAPADRKAYLVSGPGIPRAARSSPLSFGALDSALRPAGVELVAWTLTGRAPVPDGATLLVMPGTQVSLSVPQLAAVWDFLTRGGTLLRLIDNADTTDPNAPTAWSYVGDTVRQTTTGLLAIFVPVSILKATSIVTFAGSRASLLMADADTVFQDVMLAVLGLMLWRRRPYARADLPALIFSALLVVTCTVLSAYVVTNFGTLVRLRLLSTVPAWIAVLALTARGRTNP